MSLSPRFFQVAAFGARRHAGLAMGGATVLVLVLGLGACDGDKPAPASSNPASSGAKGGKPYPLDVCVVSGKPLGSMGEPFSFVHEGQEIKLCCEPCLAAFKKDPAKHLAKLAQAVPSAAPPEQPLPQAPKPGQSQTP